MQAKLDCYRLPHSEHKQKIDERKRQTTELYQGGEINTLCFITGKGETKLSGNRMENPTGFNCIHFFSLAVHCKSGKKESFRFGYSSLFSPFSPLFPPPSEWALLAWIQSSHLRHQHSVQSPFIPRLICAAPANPRTAQRNTSVNYTARTNMTGI